MIEAKSYTEPLSLLSKHPKSIGFKIIGFFNGEKILLHVKGSLSPDFVSKVGSHSNYSNLGLLRELFYALNYNAVFRNNHNLSSSISTLSPSSFKFNR